MTRGALRPYRSIFRQQLIAGLQFRFAFWSRLLTNIFWGYVRSVIVVVYYTYGAGEAAIGLTQAVSMVWLQQIAMNLLPGFSGGDGAAWARIRSGDVGLELLRPIGLYAHWFANAAAAKWAPFLLAIVPVGGAALLVPGAYGLSAPASAAHFLAFAGTLALGSALSLGVILIRYALMMDLKWGENASGFLGILVSILAGAYLPLQLWPDWAQGFLYWQPFAGAMDLPLRFYAGTAELGRLPEVIALQAGWAAAFVIAGRAMIRRNLKRLTIQGG